jgi:disulfide bond formation protein DsbB
MGAIAPTGRRRHIADMHGMSPVAMPGWGYRRAALAAFLCGGAVLGTALASERWGGLVPCALCLVERWPWRIVIACGLLAAVLPRRPAQVLLVVAVLACIAGVGLGVLHVGVEHGLWPSPLPQCQAPRFSGGSIAERLRSMPLAPSKSCEDATYLIPFLPISMALMNLLASLATGVLVTVLALRPARKAP